MQQVEITVKVNGEVVKRQVEQVDGTLEDMEEKIDAMSRNLAAAALQATVIRKSTALTCSRDPAAGKPAPLR